MGYGQATAPDARADQAAIVIDGLSVAYGAQVVLEQITLALPRAAIIGLIGPNGAGKTTLLKTLVGAQRPLTGTVRVLGQPVAAVRRRIAYVPQRSAVDWSFPLSVLDVVLMGRYGHLGVWRRPGRRDREIALQALEQVGLLNRRHCLIGELSGGQQQRVFLARALAQQADLLLLDEPFNGIDTTTQALIFDLLCQQRQQGKTILLSTHDLHSVERNCDLLVALNRRLIAYGPVAAVFTAPVLRSTFGAQVVVVDGAPTMINAHAPVHEPS
ncbi:metal ABC transporter ATP-binding protein [Kallotenue papyrolyticum]|uniref:metal ABC transporter ATP-binding protein n=1 Tax=Kallotenue papyrolyticum TaxID=1325125 RepID=UPI00047867D6|nr:metal ABC transporter ATP-binding protein [Kallotenue papyrolyticum]